MEQKTSTWRQYYYGPTIAALAIYGLFAVWAVFTHNLAELQIVAVLAVFEVVLSFDNAIVNAKVLRRLDEDWQRYFLTVGIFVAVIGMRLIVPLATVSIGGHVNPVRAAVMAVADPREYAMYVQRAHLAVIVFGGIYLLQIILSFFLNADAEGNATWLKPLEWPLGWLGMRVNPRLLVPACSLATVGLLTLRWPGHLTAVLVSGVSSVMLHQLVSELSARFEQHAEEAETAEDTSEQQAQRTLGRIDWVMLSLFLYLELQDATFSFDSVFGGFAFTLVVPLIMLGSGIGALYVRAMTIHIAQRGVLDEFQYLANGAYWAIGVLPFAMWFEWPEYVPAVTSTSLIAAALLHSLYANRRGGSAVSVVNVL